MFFRTITRSVNLGSVSLGSLGLGSVSLKSVSLKSVDRLFNIKSFNGSPNSIQFLTPQPKPIKKKTEYKGNTQSFGKTKVASKRLLKKYKLKTHNGAAARWMVMGNGSFKRGQAGRNHFNMKMSSVKRRSKKVKVISTPMQTKKLKKLLPYFKKKYMK
jgi:ribosomal protein L35